MRLFLIGICIAFIHVFPSHLVLGHEIDLTVIHNAISADVDSEYCIEEEVTKQNVDCDKLSDTSKGWIAVSIVSCKLKLMGRPAPIACNSSLITLKECGSLLTSEQFQMWSTFNAHIDNICYYIHSRQWKQRMQSTAELLLESSSITIGNLDLIQSAQSELSGRVLDSLSSITNINNQLLAVDDKIQGYNRSFSQIFAYLDYLVGLILSIESYISELLPAYNRLISSVQFLIFYVSLLCYLLVFRPKVRYVLLSLLMFVIDFTLFYFCHNASLISDISIHDTPLINENLITHPLLPSSFLSSFLSLNFTFRSFTKYYFLGGIGFIMWRLAFVALFLIYHVFKRYTQDHSVNPKRVGTPFLSSSTHTLHVDPKYQLKSISAPKGFRNTETHINKISQVEVLFPVLLSSFLSVSAIEGSIHSPSPQHQNEAFSSLSSSFETPVKDVCGRSRNSSSCRKAQSSSVSIPTRTRAASARRNLDFPSVDVHSLSKPHEKDLLGTISILESKHHAVSLVSPTTDPTDIPPTPSSSTPNLSEIAEDLDSESDEDYSEGSSISSSDEQSVVSLSSQTEDSVITAIFELKTLSNTNIAKPLQSDSLLYRNAVVLLTSKREIRDFIQTYF